MDRDSDLRFGQAAIDCGFLRPDQLGGDLGELEVQRDPAELGHLGGVQARRHAIDAIWLGSTTACPSVSASVGAAPGAGVASFSAAGAVSSGSSSSAWARIGWKPEAWSTGIVPQ